MEKTPPKSHRILNENHNITFRVSENLTVEVSSSYLQKCGITKFCQKEDYGRVFICVLALIPRGDRIDSVVLKCCDRAHSNENRKF